MKRLTYLFTFALPLLVLVSGAVYMLGQSERPGPDLAYDTAAVTRGSVRKIVTSSGPVRALVTVSVGSQLSGQIDKVEADFNTEVKAGDLLARMDDRTFSAKVAQAKADLAAARASVLNQEALLRKGEAVLKLAERSTSRQRTLAARGFSAQAALDTATRDAEVAAAEITVAGAMIENAKAVVAQREAALDQALIDLDRTRINAPIDGTVISRTVDPGQTVAASLQAPELFKIAQDLKRVRIEAQVSEADVGVISDGNPVVFTVDAYPDREFQGRVTQVRLSAIELNSVVTYTVIIEAENGDRRLFPGMTANVQIEAARRDGVLRVANEALRFRPRGGAGIASGEREGGQPGRRAERQIERLASELELTPEQQSALREALEARRAEWRLETGAVRNGKAGEGDRDRGQMRQLWTSTVEQVLRPLLSEAQKPLFERWKTGREGVRMGAVWVLDSGNRPERRSVRLAISDDEFTEVAGGELAEGDRVITRAKQARP